MSKIDLVSQDWCNLVFAERNKNYGAFKLRADSANRHLKAVILVIVLTICAILIPMLIKMATPKHEDKMTEVVRLSQLQEAKVKDEHIIKRVEPKQVQPQRIKSSIKFTAPVIKKDEEVAETDEMKSQEELGETKVAISVADVQGNDDEHGEDIADIKELITSEEEEKVYDVVEQQPVFPGGEEKLLDYISKNLKYPSIAQEQGIQGVVILRFIVTSSGHVGEVQVIKSLDPYCDREAKRVIQSLPAFIPGKQQGKPVSVWFNIPVRFKIE